MSRVYNFSAGPAVLPEEVLKEVAAEMLDYNGTGMSVLEMSHRSPAFQAIVDEAEKDLRELMNIPENYRVLFLQGGAHLQFAMVPMNLMKNKVADYIVMARRRGNTWYVGGMTDWTARDIQVNLDFLADGEYEVEIFRDGINADRTACDYKREVISLSVKNQKVGPLDLHLAPGGGFAVKITLK